MKNLLLATMFILVFTDCHKAIGQHTVIDPATGITDAPKDLANRRTRRIDSFYGVDFRTMDVFNPKNCKHVEKLKADPSQSSVYFQMDLIDCTVSIQNNVHAYYLTDPKVPELKNRLGGVHVEPQVATPDDIPAFYKYYTQKYGDSIAVDPDQENPTSYKSADVIESCKGVKNECAGALWTLDVINASFQISFTFLDRYDLVLQGLSRERDRKGRQAVE